MISKAEVGGDTRKSGVSIVIVNYFSERDIVKLYGAILKDFINRNDYEIIVVDNSGSFEASVDPEILADGVLRVFKVGAGNEGFGRGMNLGFSHASFDKICVINPDIFYEGQVLTVLAQRLDESSQKVCCVTCSFVDTDGVKQLSVYNSRILSNFRFAILVCVSSIPMSIRKALPFMRGKSSIPKLDPLWTGCSGALFLMKAQIFEAIGGFDADFFMYCEDTELFRRRISGRYQTLYFDDLCVEHTQGTSDVYGLMSYQNDVSYLLYLRKCGLSYLFLWLVLITPKYLTILVSGLFGLNKHKKEALHFFSSWYYLPLIIRRGGGFGGLRKPLKINQIPD